MMSISSSIGDRDWPAGQAGVDHFARLCGGMLVAMPTAMPAEPLISRFGMRAAGSAVPLRTVVVRAEIDGFLVDVGQQLGRWRSWPCGTSV